MNESEAALLRDVAGGAATALAVMRGDELMYEWVNARYQAIAPGEQMVGRRLADVFPEVAEWLAPALRAVLATGETLVRRERGLRVPRAPGAPLESTSFSFVARRLAADAGERRLVLELQETTGEEQARAAAEELSAVLDAIADGLVLYAEDGRIIRMNAVAERVLGISEEDAARPIAHHWGRTRIEDPLGQPLPVEDSPWARALRGETVAGLELRWITGRGEARWLSWSAAPIRRGEGLAAVVATFVDVTRVRELLEEREDLVRMISHDLRTPLSVVLTHAQLLSRAPERDVPRRAVAIRQAGERMARMIDELVEAVRLETGQHVVDLRPVDVAPFVDDVRRRLEGAVDVARIRVSAPGSLPAARADPAALERVLVNLVTNALKYSPPSEHVDIALAARGGAVTLTVRDRGPGIPREEQGRVFERFYRARAAVRKEGLGLGLYISRLLTEQMGGTIWLESAQGKGAAFTVALPAAVDSPALANPVA